MSPRRLAALQAQADAMRRQGDALKADIAAVLTAHEGRRLKAFAVLSYLKRDPPPSLRRVPEILREFQTNNGCLPYRKASLDKR